MSQKELREFIDTTHIIIKLLKESIERGMIDDSSSGMTDGALLPLVGIITDAICQLKMYSDELLSLKQKMMVERN